MEETFGIEKLKEVGLDLVKFAVKVEDALEDKKLKFTEAIGLGIFAVPKAMNHAGDAATIKAEIKDLSADELEELVVYIGEELDLANDSIEDVIEAALLWLAATNNVVYAVKRARG